MRKLTAFFKQLPAKTKVLWRQIFEFIIQKFQTANARYKALPVRKQRFVQTGTGIVFVLLLYLVFVTSLRSYYLHKNVHSVHHVIPGSASTYLEIRNSNRLKDLLVNSRTGAAILQSNEWQNLFLTPEFNDLFAVIHILSIKTGIPLTIADIPDWFGDSIGIAVFPDKSRLLVAQTNLKAKAGIAIAAALVEKKDLEPSKTPPDESTEQIVPQVYPQGYQSDQLPLHNLTVSRINAGPEKYFYFVLLDNYLFVSDSFDTLQMAIHEGADGNGGIFAGKAAAKVIENDYAAENSSILLVLNNRESFAAPLLNSFVNGTSSAIVLHAETGKLLQAKIFNSDFSEKKESEPRAPVKWETVIPRNTVIALFSTETAANVLEKNLLLENNWKEFAAGLRSFMDAAGIDPAKMLSGSGGFAFTYHGFKPGKTIVPDFSFIYPAQKYDPALLLSVFKHKNRSVHSYQGLEYQSYRLDSPSEFTPSAAFTGGMQILSSNENRLTGFLAAKKGNLPVIADAGFSSKDYPTHLVINLPAAMDDLKQFYLYGAEKSEDYTPKTIEQDISGLFAPFAGVQYLHIELGRDAALTGNIILTGN